CSSRCIANEQNNTRFGNWGSRALQRRSPGFPSGYRPLFGTVSSSLRCHCGHGREFAAKKRATATPQRTGGTERGATPAYHRTEVDNGQTEPAWVCARKNRLGEQPQRVIFARPTPLRLEREYAFEDADHVWIDERYPTAEPCRENGVGDVAADSGKR